jgi:hypothetical protein
VEAGNIYKASKREANFLCRQLASLASTISKKLLTIAYVERLAGFVAL